MSMYRMCQVVYDILLIYVLLFVHILLICVTLCVRFDISCAFAHALPRPSLVYTRRWDSVVWCADRPHH